MNDTPPATPATRAKTSLQDVELIVRTMAETVVSNVAYFFEVYQVVGVVFFFF